MSVKEKLIGLLAGVFCGGGAVALAFGLAFRTFWWCPAGGCSLASGSAKLHLLTNVLGVCALLVVSALILLFAFVLLARPFVQRATLERVLLSARIRGLGWHDKLQLKWVAVLYRRSAA